MLLEVTNGNWVQYLLRTAQVGRLLAGHVLHTGDLVAPPSPVQAVVRCSRSAGQTPGGRDGTDKTSGRYQQNVTEVLIFWSKDFSHDIMISRLDGRIGGTPTILQTRNRTTREMSKDHGKKLLIHSNPHNMESKTNPYGSLFPPHVYTEFSFSIRNLCACKYMYLLERK